MSNRENDPNYAEFYAEVMMTGDHDRGE